VDFVPTPVAREAFMAAVPDAHKEFLRDLPWVVELDVPWELGKLVCVHAGLNTFSDGPAGIPLLGAEAQLEALRHVSSM
jgi:hypothetical protein